MKWLDPIWVCLSAYVEVVRAPSNEYRVARSALFIASCHSCSILLLVLSELVTLYKASDNLKIPVLNPWDLVGVFVAAEALSRTES